MSMLLIVIGAALILSIAYWTYGPILSRLLKLDPHARTPAVEHRNDVDYMPIGAGALLSQHFSAIAAAGPIVGPILAGKTFGWAPALLWILLGAIFIGGVHDMTALVASIRHKALSIAEVVRKHMSRRAFLLFLLFVWLALIYIIVAFTDITAGAFVGIQKLENGEAVSGAGIASSSLMYLALPIIMGLVVRFGGISMERATFIFLPLVAVSIWLGQKLPVDMTSVLGYFTENSDEAAARRAWNILLLVYCCIASVVPMWLLLQPRGQLGGYFLYAALGAGALGLLLGGKPIQFPAFTEGTLAGTNDLFPMLFITIACGACSGFHALIASGTTSKQLRVETDARVIGYGAMLLESMVAIVSLCCVMMLAKDSPVASSDPNNIYAQGIGAFLQKVGIRPELGISFALMAFTTFVYDTLDVCTRLGRYIIQELTGWHNRKGMWLGTLLTGGLPAIFLLQTIKDSEGKPVQVWRTFWALFGASNQLLAALTLLGVTVWLWRTRKAIWVWFVTGIPTVWMYAMSSWALVNIMRGPQKLGFNELLMKYADVFRNIGRGLTGQLTLNEFSQQLVPLIALVLLTLAVLMLVEALLIFARMGSAGTPPAIEPSDSRQALA